MASILHSPIKPDAAGQATIDRVAVGASLAVAVLAAWSYLLYQTWAMEHMDMVEMSMPSLDAWGARDLVLVFTMWAVMMVGMMAPTVAPMLLLFAGIQRERRARGGPFVASWVFLLGYLVIWTVFSVFATLAQWALHAAALLSPTMDRAIPLVGGMVVIAAGVYQWTPAKFACLARCRSPLGFIMTEWRERVSGAFVMGLRHGLFCAGCCWALMSLLLAVGVMNLYWVAGLTLFVLMEKTFRFGPILARAGGLLLIGWGVWMLAA